VQHTVVVLACCNLFRNTCGNVTVKSRRNGWKASFQGVHPGGEGRGIRTCCPGLTRMLPPTATCDAATSLALSMAGSPSGVRSTTVAVSGQDSIRADRLPWALSVSMCSMAWLHWNSTSSRAPCKRNIRRPGLGLRLNLNPTLVQHLFKTLIRYFSFRRGGRGGGGGGGGLTSRKERHVCGCGVRRVRC